MSIAERVAARVQAELQVGKTFYTGTLKVHRYQDSLLVTDMTNAGKRGKKVREMHLSPSYGFKTNADRMAVLDELTDAVTRVDTYAQALDAVRKLGAKYPARIDVSESDLRGVDVEPMGTKLTIKNNTGLSIELSPGDFRVLSRWPMVHPKTGEPMDTFQDTIYYPYKKQDAILFYGWAKDNLTKLNTMTMAELRRQWDALGVKYDSH